MKLGVIAEDNSDVAVLQRLALTMLHPRKLGIKRFVGNGCGKLHRKCGAWADNLVRQGCSWVVVAHDLDQNDEPTLRRELEQAIANVRTRAQVILIPKREIEAWLLYDAQALRSAFNGRSKPRLPSSPEALLDPKRKLSELIRRAFGKEYVNTIHNERIAQHIHPRTLQRSCSFSRYPIFVKTIATQMRQPAGGVYVSPSTGKTKLDRSVNRIKHA